MFTKQDHPASYSNAWQLPDPDADRRRRHRRLATLLASTTVVIVTAAALALTLAPRAETDLRGCTTTERPSQAVEFLIDQSDPFPENVLAFAWNEVHRRMRALGLGDLLSVLVLGHGTDGQALTEAFSRCRPPDGQAVNALIDNPERRDRDYLEQFETPLQAALERALVPAQANTSPLLEALHAIAHRPAFDGGGQGRSLIVFSDALQHSALVSFFKRGYRFEELVQRNSVYLTGLHERLAGACVEMYVVSSKYPNQTAWPELESFWRAYWGAAGVSCLTYNRI